ncbi:pantoate--beta-alanine ligase [Caenispirillum salinarum]|uniref:pantoate--beta-alanine ligase n=1 Tax=Caenispirillum salinarum TaxID=859058 RepID=UPI00384B6331
MTTEAPSGTGGRARGPHTVSTVADLREQVLAWRGEGLRVALVPTMGALHEGHMSLIRRAKMLADRVVVSVFVNPTQFGPNEDFGRYPRQLAQDRFKVGMAGGQLVYAPTVDEMYPAGFATTVSVTGVSSGLCGDARPGHFDGVATVVCKLLLQALPDVAVFGEKDWQQLAVIRRMATDLNVPVTIEGAPIVREMDGLAMSSRNAYLTDDERAVANHLYKTLKQIADDIDAGVDVGQACAWGIGELGRKGFAAVDYLEVRDAGTLEPVERVTRPARVLAAAFLGKTRLIDNVACGVKA